MPVAPIGMEVKGGSDNAGAGRACEGRLVTPGRLELPTRSLGNCCSIHLSYGATLRYCRSSFRKLLVDVGSGPGGPGAT
jgi:hypothetical protein